MCTCIESLFLPFFTLLIVLAITTTVIHTRTAATITTTNNEWHIVLKYLLLFAIVQKRRRSLTRCLMLPMNMSIYTNERTTLQRMDAGKRVSTMTNDSLAPCVDAYSCIYAHTMEHEIWYRMLSMPLRCHINTSSVYGAWLTVISCTKLSNSIHHATSELLFG